MKNIKLKRYQPPSIRLQVIYLEENIATSSIVIDANGPSYPQVNDWEDGYGETAGNGQYDL